MTVQHVFSNTGGDWTGTVTVFNSQGSTVTAEASVIVRPSDWNSVHNQLYTLTGNTNNSSVVSGTNVLLEGLGAVTLRGSTAAGVGTIGISAPAQTNQTLGGYFVGNTTGESSSSTFDARTLSIDGAGIVSAGWSNGSMRVSATQSNQNVTAANGGFAFQTLSFSNANGVSFGTSAGSAITASYTVPTVPAQLSVGDSNLGNTAGDTGVFTGRVVFVGSDNITLSGSSNAGSATVSIIGGAGGGLTNIRVSAGTTSNLLSAVTFADANGVSFGIDASTVTASVAAQTVDSARIYALGNTTGQSSSSTYDLRTLSIEGAGFVSVGWSNGSFRISGTQTNPVVSNAIQSVGSATGSGTNTSRFAADDHVHAGVFSVGVSNVGNTAGDTRVDVGRFVLAGGNNITLSQGTAANALNTITVSAANQSNQTAGLYAVGNTTGESSSSTFDARTVSFVGQGIASVGFSNGSVNISVPAGGGGLTNIRVSAGTTSNLLSAITLADSNGISFGINASTITASYTRPVVSNAIQSVGSATNSGTNTSRFAADDHVHAGVFSMGVSTGGNTSGDTRVDVGRFVLAGGGAVTLSQATAANALNTITVSAPATSSLVGQSGVSISTNGSTITVMGEPVSGTNIFGPGAEVIVGAMGQNTLWFLPACIPAPVALNQLYFPLHFTAATNSTGTYTISQELAFYTQVNSTQISRYTSWQVTTTFNHSGTANSASNVGGYRTWVGTVAAATLPPGRYIIGHRSSTASSSHNATISNWIVSNVNSAMSGGLMAANNATHQYFPFQGSYSATSGAWPDSVAHSEINGSAAVNQRPPTWTLGRT